MQDTIELKLPSGKTVEIRNYTTRNDDEKAEQVLYLGVEAKQRGNEQQEVSFPIANVMASQGVYVRRLVTSIDGDNSNVVERLKDLRSADYEAVSEKVSEIVNENSPKAKEAKKASKNATSEK